MVSCWHGGRHQEGERPGAIDSCRPGYWCTHSSTSRSTGPARLPIRSDPPKVGTVRNPDLRLRVSLGVCQPPALCPTESSVGRPEAPSIFFHRCPQFPQAHPSLCGIHLVATTLLPCGDQSIVFRHKMGIEQVQRGIVSNLAHRHPQAATLPRPLRGRSKPPTVVLRVLVTFPQQIPHL